MPSRHWSGHTERGAGPAASRLVAESGLPADPGLEQALVSLQAFAHREAPAPSGQLKLLLEGGKASANVVPLRRRGPAVVGTVVALALAAGVGGIAAATSRPESPSVASVGVEAGALAEYPRPRISSAPAPVMVPSATAAKASNGGGTGGGRANGAQANGARAGDVANAGMRVEAADGPKGTAAARTPGTEKSGTAERRAATQNAGATEENAGAKGAGNAKKNAGAKNAGDAKKNVAEKNIAKKDQAARKAAPAKAGATVGATGGSKTADKSKAAKKPKGTAAKGGKG
jgi:hypothetical protein